MEGKVPLTAFATVTDRTTPTTTTSAPPVAEPREASSSSSSSSVSFTFATPPAAQPISRRRQKRVLFEKGFSQQDWLRLTRAPRENLALAGLQGAEVDRLRDVLGRSGGRKIPLEEVARHKSEDDVWMALNGKVYNVTRYVKFHPGGVDWLMRGAGTDATKLFNKYHKWVNVDFMLQKTFLGFLDTTTGTGTARE